MSDPEPFHVLSPALEQAIAIAEVLRKSNPARPITGLVMPGEGKPRAVFPYHGVAPFSEADTADLAPLIPTGSRSTAWMLSRGEIRLGSITMPPAALRFYDKVWSLEAAAAAGLPVPRTWTEPGDIAAFPAFFKSRAEGGGRRGIAHNRSDLPEDTRDMIFQEYIASPGTYGVCFIATDGVVLAMHIHHEIESYPATGGSAVIIEQKRDDRLQMYAERLLGQSKYSGWGLVEFKYCPRRDDYVFMELNAKFWATSEFAFRNEPLFTRLLFDAEPVANPVSRLIFMHRAFARGPHFLARVLPRYLRGSELRFIAGMWQLSLARLLMPKPVLGLVRKARAR